MTTTTAGMSSPVPLRKDAHTIGLIGLARHLAFLSPAAAAAETPWLIGEFGLSYSELGLLVSVFFVVSAWGGPGWVVVDHCGCPPRTVLALGSFCAGRRIGRLAQGYAGWCCSGTGWFGQCAVSPGGLHHSQQTRSGPAPGPRLFGAWHQRQPGMAVAPVFLAALPRPPAPGAQPVFAAAVLAACVLALLLWQRAAIDDRQGNWAHQVGAPPRPPEHPSGLSAPAFGMAVLFVLLLEYLCLERHPELCQPCAADDVRPATQSGGPGGDRYMLFGGSLAMVVGGFLVGRVERLERVIGICLLASAALLVLAGSGVLGGMAVLAVTFAGGPGHWLAGPSRDMLIKRRAPGATGRVYGTVFRLDLGFALAALVFGALLDRLRSAASSTARPWHWRWRCRRRWWEAGWPVVLAGGFQFLDVLASNVRCCYQNGICGAGAASGRRLAVFLTYGSGRGGKGRTDFAGGCWETFGCRYRVPHQSRL